MDKRMLTVYDIWKTKTLRHQVMSIKKRKQLGVSLFTFEDEEEDTHIERSAGKYLAMLHTYLLALATAGSSKVPGAPTEESHGSDATEFVSVPWDVLQAYHFRASRAAMMVPEASRLSWLEQRDSADRAAWVSQFREGDETLGQVVKSIRKEEPIGTHLSLHTSQVLPSVNSGPVRIIFSQGSSKSINPALVSSNPIKGSVEANLTSRRSASRRSLPTHPVGRLSRISWHWRIMEQVRPG